MESNGEIVEGVELEVFEDVEMEELKDLKEEDQVVLVVEVSQLGIDPHGEGDLPEGECEEKKKEGKDQEKLSSRRLTFLICFLGFQAIGLSVINGIQVIYSAPYLESCGFSRTVTSLFWLLGPVMTLIGSPFVGCLSDAIFIPYIGRRRPFLVLSGISMCISLSLFSNAKVFGNFFFDSSPSSSMVVTKVVAGTSFLLLDFSIRVFDISGRSLLADLIPQSQQLDANVWVQGLLVGFGSVYGFGLGVVPWSKFVPYTSENIQVLYFLCMSQLIFCVGITCLFVREKKYQLNQSEPEEKNEKEEEEEKTELKQISISDQENNINIVSLEKNEKEEKKENNEVIESENINIETSEEQQKQREEIESDDNNFRKKNKNNFWIQGCRILGILCRLPSSFWMCYIIQSISMLTANIVYIYISIFICVVVMEGDPNAPNGSEEKEKFEKGLMWGNIGGIMLAISSISCGFLMSCVTEIVSVKLMWFFIQLCLSGSILLGCILKFTVYLEMLPFILFGIAQTGLNTIPYSVINVISRDSEKLREDKALIQAIFSTTASFPCIIISLTAGPSLQLLKIMGLPDILSLFYISGSIAMISVVFVLLMKIPESMEEKKKIGVFCCPCDSVRMIGRLFSQLGKKKVGIYRVRKQV